MTDILQLVGAVVAAVSITAVVFLFLAPFDGPIGFVLVAYAIFLGIYALVVWQDEDATAVVDRLVAVIVTSLAAVLVSALFYVVALRLINGIEALKFTNFYSEDMSQHRAARPARLRRHPARPGGLDRS